MFVFMYEWSISGLLLSSHCISNMYTMHVHTTVIQKTANNALKNLLEPKLVKWQVKT